MIDYDYYMEQRQGNQPDDATDAWLCTDRQCTGHLVAGQHCTEPIMLDETEEGVCP